MEEKPLFAVQSVSVRYDVNAADKRNLEAARQLVRDGDLNVRLKDSGRRRLGMMGTSSEETKFEEFEFT